MQVSVEVPEGATAGTELSVGVEDEQGNARYLKITVPAGAKPGQKLVISADLSCGTG